MRPQPVTLLWKNPPSEPAANAMMTTSCGNFDHGGQPPSALGNQSDGTARPDLGTGSSEDESAAEINQYMQELLDRVQQRSSASRTLPPEAPPAHDKSPADVPGRAATGNVAQVVVPAARQSAGMTDEPSASAAAIAPAPPTPLAVSPVGNVPESHSSTSPSSTSSGDTAAAPRVRPTPPERACDMALLRQVANDSAHDAIAAHERKQLAQQAYSKLSVALVAAFAAALLFQMSSTGWSLTYVAAVVALLVAVFWGCHHMVLWWRSWLKSPRKPRAPRT